MSGYRECRRCEFRDHGGPQPPCQSFVTGRVYPDGHRFDSVTVRDVLITAREKIEAGDWCQKAIARDAAGEVIDPESTGAVAWCITGALVAATGGPNQADSLGVVLYWSAAHVLMKAAMEVDRLITSAQGASLPAWNDQTGRTKAQVLDAYGMAILWSRPGAGATV